MGEPETVASSDSVPPRGDPVVTGERVTPAVSWGPEPPEVTGEAEFGEPAAELCCSGFWMETGSVFRAAAADVKAGLNTKGGLPETLASGFSTEAGMVFNFDAAAATDGLAIVAGSVAPGFTFVLEVCTITGEAMEAGGVVTSFVVPVFVTTAPSDKVVRCAEPLAGEPEAVAPGDSGPAMDAEPEAVSPGDAGPAGDAEPLTGEPEAVAPAVGVTVGWFSPEPAVTGGVSEPMTVPVAETATDCGTTGEDAGSAARVVVAVAPMPELVGTTPFTIVLVVAEAPLPALTFDAGTPEVGSPLRDD